MTQAQKGSSILLVMLGAIMMGGLIVGAYYFGTRKNPANPPLYNLNQPAIYPSVTPQVNVVNPELPTASNTYINSAYKYSINYPAGYYVLGADFVSASPTSSSVTIIKGSPTEINNLTSGDNIEKYYYDGLSIYPQDGACSDPKYGSPVKSDINIDGGPAVKWTGNSPTFADPFWGDVIIQVNKGAICYKFAFLRDPDNKAGSEQILSDLISGFKFTN